MFLLRHIWAVVHVWIPKTPSAFTFNDLADDGPSPRFSAKPSRMDFLGGTPSRQPIEHPLLGRFFDKFSDGFYSNSREEN